MRHLFSCLVYGGLAKMRAEGGLEQRRREIIGAVVRRYVSNGMPVGSKAVVERLSESVSPATVRNVMAELETEGYLAQPHTSAGRVPTDKAYRFYVDHVVSSTRPGPATARYIKTTLATSSPGPEQLMVRTSQVLSKVSHNVGLVLGPALDEKILQQIKFVKLPDQRVLAVIVSRPDLIENKVIHLEEDLSQEDLDQTASYLNAEFCGWSVGTIRLEIFKRIEADQALCDRLLRNVASLLMWGALASEEPGPLFVEGTSQMLDHREFEDIDRIKELLAAVEQKVKIIKILSACIPSSNLGVQILIGQENPDRQMQHCTFIVAPIHYRNRAVGALGVIGPTRMEYERAITTVSYVAHLCSKLLSSN